MKFTAAVFLTVFASQRPAQFKAEPERIATIAVAAERAKLKLLPKWRKDEVYLGAALATAAISESGLMLDTHEGSRRGRAREICLMQIHPSNPQWKNWAPSFESLAGMDVLSTERCLLAGGQSLTTALNYCMSRRYYTNWSQAMWTMYHYGSRCWLSPHAYPRTRLMLRIAHSKWVPNEEQVRLVAAVQ